MSYDFKTEEELESFCLVLNNNDCEYCPCSVEGDDGEYYCGATVEEDN